MSVAHIQFKTNPDNGFVEINRSNNIQEPKVKALFNKHIHYMLRYLAQTNGPITFKAEAENLTVSNVSTVLEAFGELIEAKNMVKVSKEMDDEEKQSEGKPVDEDFFEILDQQLRTKVMLEKSDELLKMKVAFDAAKKETGIDIVFNDF